MTAPRSTALTRPVDTREGMGRSYPYTRLERAGGAR